MSGKDERLEGQLPLGFEDGQEHTSAQRHWNEELGLAASALEVMMKKPTAQRPFVYEVKFDLLSTGRGVVRVIAKGFGEEGGLITFHDASSFGDGIKGLAGRLRAGKVSWYMDSYMPKNYQERLALWQSGKVYRLPE